MTRDEAIPVLEHMEAQQRQFVTPPVANPAPGMSSRGACQAALLQCERQANALAVALADMRELATVKAQREHWRGEAEALEQQRTTLRAGKAQAEAERDAARRTLAAVEATLRALQSEINRWCLDLRDDPPIGFICETIQPSVEEALAALAQTAQKEL